MNEIRETVKFRNLVFVEAFERLYVVGYGNAHIVSF